MSNPNYPQTSDGSLTEEEKSILFFAVGDKTCQTSPTSQWIRYLVVALIGTILFVLLSLAWVDLWLAPYLPNPGHRLIAKAILFFIILFLVDASIHSWQNKNCPY